MILNAAGGIVNTVWRELPNHYPGITLGEYVVMPNHFHGIIHIVGAQFIAPEFSTTHQGVIKQGALKQGTLKQGAMNRAPTVGNIIRAFKARCTCAINKVNESVGISVWQRNYYEHIIRNEEAYLKIAEYIQINPLQWQDDTYYLSTVQTVGAQFIAPELSVHNETGRDESGRDESGRDESGRDKSRPYG